MITRITAKELHALDFDCVLSNRKTLGTYPYACFDETLDDIYKTVKINDDDILVLLYDVTNKPIRNHDDDCYWKNFIKSNNL